MEIEKSDRSGITILELSGKFDIEQSDAFQKQFNSFVTDRPNQIGLNMTEVNFIDSSGMGALIKALNHVKAYGGEMILFGLKPMILNVFKLAKLDNFFKVMTPEEFERQFPAD